MCARMYVTGLQVKERKRQKRCGTERPSELKATSPTENMIDRLKTMFPHIHILLLFVFSLHEILSSSPCPSTPTLKKEEEEKKRAILQQLQLYFHFLVAAGSEGDQIQPGANPLSQTAGSAQAPCCLCVAFD